MSAEVWGQIWKLSATFLCKWAKPPTCRILKTVCVPCCILKRNCAKHRSSDMGICSVSPLHRKALLSNQQQQVRSDARRTLLTSLWFDSSPLENPENTSTNTHKIKKHTHWFFHVCGQCKFETNYYQPVIHHKPSSI